MPVSLKLRLCLPCASSPVFLPSILTIALIDLIPLVLCAPSMTHRKGALSIRVVFLRQVTCFV